MVILFFFNNFFNVLFIVLHVWWKTSVSEFLMRMNHLFIHDSRYLSIWQDDALLEGAENGKSNDEVMMHR